jgi:hypothetical protein
MPGAVAPTNPAQAVLDKLQAMDAQPPSASPAQGGRGEAPSTARLPARPDPDLTAAQRAVAAARCMNHTPLSRAGRKQLASRFRVGENAVQQARALLEEAPDLLARVESCESSLAAAYQELQGRRQPAAQRGQDAPVSTAVGPAPPTPGPAPSQGHCWHASAVLRDLPGPARPAVSPVELLCCRCGCRGLVSFDKAGGGHGPRRPEYDLGVLVSMGGDGPCVA